MTAPTTTKVQGPASQAAGKARPEDGHAQRRRGHRRPVQPDVAEDQQDRTTPTARATTQRPAAAAPGPAAGDADVRPRVRHRRDRDRQARWTSGADRRRAPVRRAHRDKPKDPPPARPVPLGALRFPGIVTSLPRTSTTSRPDGTPLRAKLSLTITEQDLAFEANATGPARARPAMRPSPGEPPHGTTPGTRGTGSPTSVAAGQRRRERAAAADPHRRGPGRLARGHERARQPDRAGRRRAGAARRRRSRPARASAVGAGAGAAFGAGVGTGCVGGVSRRSAGVSARPRSAVRWASAASAGVSAGIGVLGTAAVGAAIGSASVVGRRAECRCLRWRASASAEVSQIASLGGSVRG